MAIFSEKIIGKVKGLLQEYWDSKIDHLLREANRISEKELILEKDADIIAAGLKKIIESASEGKVEELLRGVLDNRTNPDIYNFFKNLRGHALTLQEKFQGISKANAGGISNAKKILSSMEGYRKKAKSMPAALAHVAALCKDTIRLREQANEMIERVNGPTERLLEILQKALRETKKYDYKGLLLILQELRAPRAELFEILTGELGMYHFETKLLEDEEGLEKVRDILVRYGKEKTTASSPKDIKRTILRAGARALFYGAALYHIAGITMGTLLQTYPITSLDNPGKVQMAMHGEVLNEIKGDYVVEDITIRSRSDKSVLLRGKFYKTSQNPKKVALDFHGRSTNQTSLLTEVKNLLDAGTSVATIDFLHHGNSPNTISNYKFLFGMYPEQAKGFTSVGDYETLDVINLLEYMESRGVEEVCLVGHSMGGVAAIRGAARYHGKIKIMGIFAEGVFCNYGETLEFNARSMGFGKTVTTPVRALAKWATLSDPDKVNPEEDIKHVRCPVFLAQGDQDTVVPPDNLQRLAASAKQAGVPASTMVFHGGHYDFSPMVEEALARFVKSVMP